MEKLFEQLTGIGEAGGTLVMGRPSIIIVSCLVFIFTIIMLYKRKSDLKRRLWFITFTFAVYISLLIRITLFPITVFPNTEYRHLITMMMFDRDFPYTISEILNLHLIPLEAIILSLPRELTWFHWYFSLRGILGNIVLLYPFGMFLGYISTEFTLKKAIWMGIIISGTIEISQLLINLATQFPNRIVAIDDVILNTIGFVVGVLIIKKIKPYFDKIIDKMK